MHLNFLNFINPTYFFLLCISFYLNVFLFVWLQQASPTKLIFVKYERVGLQDNTDSKANDVIAVWNAGIYANDLFMFSGVSLTCGHRNYIVSFLKLKCIL